MRSWPAALRDGAITGSVASVVSTAALAALSRAQAGTAAAATNSTSHWLWDRRAFRQDGLSLRYTATGYAIHHLASVFWGVLCERYLAREGPRQPGAMAAQAAMTAAAAVVGDYVIAPRRLTPGVEARLSPPAVGAFYLAFGAGLALGMACLGGLRTPRPARGRPAARAAARRT